MAAQFKLDRKSLETIYLTLFRPLFLSLQILPGASQHSFECLYYLPKSFPKSPPLWQFNTITWSKHCNFGTCSQVYTWHQTFYLIKYHAILVRYIHMYTYTTGFQPSNWYVVSTLIPHPYPCPNQNDIPSLYDDVIIFNDYCIYSLCSHKAVCFFLLFFFVFFFCSCIVLFSNEYPPLNMLNY